MYHTTKMKITGNKKKFLVLFIGLSLFLMIAMNSSLFAETQSAPNSIPAQGLTPQAIPPPTIANVTQTPPRDDVGYLVDVNVSCDIESVAALSTIQINYTNNGWTNNALVDMSGSGNGTYWGILPGMSPGFFVQYCIFAEDTWGNQSISAEHNYTIIDNFPPDIVHQNSSNWLDPVSPFPSDADVRIECEVTDLVSIAWVKINITTDSGANNVTYNMIWNGTAMCYYFDYSIGLFTSIIYYNIHALDDNDNFAMTPRYSITIDDSPPQVASWEDPGAPQYNQTPYIYANVTDMNTIANVAMKWSLDWTTNFTLPISNIGGETWRTDTPLPAQAWNTTVYWLINATDEENAGVTYFSYLVGDYTPPNVTAILYAQNPAPSQPITINIVMDEPSMASGFNQCVLYYGLSTEGYAMKPITIVHIAGDFWQVTIPGHADVTVRWYIYIEDCAGNNYTSSTYQFTLEGDGIPAFELIPVLFGFIIGILLSRKHKLTLRSIRKEI